jgi:hypothetical protein
MELTGYSGNLRTERVWGGAQAPDNAIRVISCLCDLAVRSGKVRVLIVWNQP